MVVERTKDEVIIRISSAVDTEDLQELLDYIRFIASPLFLSNLVKQEPAPSIMQMICCLHLMIKPKARQHGNQSTKWQAGFNQG